jgi:ectoine hydroxylase-related dioxygenase (phytanoyl-CoA dioxygenase family)
MSNYLTSTQQGFWKKNGYIIIKDYFNEEQKAELVNWVEDLETRPETAGKWMKYFETPATDPNGRQLCRVENFLQFHEGFDELLRGEKLIGVLSELMGEPAMLFKEKINFKLPGGNGFLPHQDAPAFTSFGQKFHITLMVSIDASNPENGCLQMAPAMHDKGMLPTAPDATVDSEYAETLNWEYVETEPGDIVLFDSYIPHKSDANVSDRPRRALYITYNRTSEGNYREEYYKEKRAVFPPDVERDPNKVYGDSGVFNVGNPVTNKM